MKVGKPKSKRVPVRLRHKIEKASAAKQRKSRKEAKKNPQWQSRLKKDPGIPNLFPFKDKVLAEIEEGKRRKEEEQQRKRDLARAQREGRNAAEVPTVVRADEDEDEDEDLVDVDEQEDEEADGNMEEDTNPMAALLASAQARASTYRQDDDADDDEGNDNEDTTEATELDGFNDAKVKPVASIGLPKQALADPIKVATALINRLEQTEEGIQQLLDYYQLPPLVTAGSDTTTRFLVDVARKRGRLGRGGIPNLHGAALTVLGDFHEQRLRLPALDVTARRSATAASSKGEVRIVSQMAQPFRIEGLFGDSLAAETESMDVEAA